MVAGENLDAGYDRRIGSFLSFKQYRTEKKLATGLCVPFVDISLRASFDSASHFSTEIRALEFAWPFQRHKVLYRLILI